MQFSDEIRRRYNKFKMADVRHIENRFWLYISAPLLADQCEIRMGDEESHADTGHVTKSAIFANSRWWTAAIMKALYQSRELSDFD